MKWIVLLFSLAYTNSDVSQGDQTELLLNRALACEFDRLSFCSLQNNGGWSFKRSWMELYEQLMQEANHSVGFYTFKFLFST